MYIEDKPYKILSFRVGPDGAAYLGLRGIPDRNAAELFRGKILEGDREDAPELEEGQYYIVDIIGLSCETENGEVLGVVTDISNLSSDVYTIEKAGKSILFPAVKGVVKKVDLENKKLIVDKKIFDEIAEWERCHVLHHEVNRGKGAALRTGFAYLKEHAPTFANLIIKILDLSKKP